MPVAPAVVLLAGRYRLEEPIASGSFGEVWRGTDTFLARPVAVKLLRPVLAADPGALAQFRESARRTGSVVHEGIARIYDYIESGSSHPPFLVMEFVDGPSLAEVVTEGPLGPGQVMNVVAQTADALHAAHQAGLVHGDIKPANVLLGRDGVVKLTNFAIAARPQGAAVTGAGPLASDLDYLAPERTSGAAGTAAGDLYGLGVLAYQCLTGGRPLRGIPMQAALACWRGLASLPAGDTAGVAALIGQLTATDPADRPTDARQVARWAEDLRNQMIGDDSGQPSGAPAVPPVAQGSRQAYEAPTVPWRWDNRRRRGRRILLAAAAAGAAVIAFLLTNVTGAQDGSHAAAAAPDKSTMVEVNGAALRGQPVRVTRRQLRHLGLDVRLRWRPSSRLAPGEVMWVRPTGRVPTGATILVVVALQRPEASPGYSIPVNGDQPQPTSKARHGHVHRGGRPHSPAPSTPAGNPTPTGSPTATGSPTPTIGPTPAPTGTATVSAPQ